MTANPSRYTAVAIGLHWLIAAAIIANLLLGWWMHDALKIAETQALAITGVQLHKSLGLTVLALSLLRLMWRLTHRPPPLPAHMPDWEQWAARAAHWTFYVLMIGVPLSGWLMVSAQWDGGKPLNVPTLWFGLFEVQHLFGLNESAEAFRATFAHNAEETHEWLAKGTAVLLVLHIGAALKHHFIQRDSVLMSMNPRVAWILLPLVATAVVYGVVRTPRSDTAVAQITQSDTRGWRLIPESSELAFSGTHANVPFRGRFTRWQAALDFDPTQLESSRFAALIETASARDGNPLHDETLPEAEWFDVANHPQAHFESTRLTPDGENRYRVEGMLSIKNRPQPVVLTATVNGDTLQLRGDFELDRAALDLGMASDPDGEYVSRRIGVSVRVEAQRN